MRKTDFGWYSGTIKKDIELPNVDIQPLCGDVAGVVFKKGQKVMVSNISEKATYIFAFPDRELSNKIRVPQKMVKTIIDFGAEPKSITEKGESALRRWHRVIGRK